MTKMGLKKYFEAREIGMHFIAQASQLGCVFDKKDIFVGSSSFFEPMQFIGPLRTDKAVDFYFSHFSYACLLRHTARN